MRRWTPTPRRWEVGELAPVRVRIDSERLALALDSLIENAVKHTEPGDRIEVKLTKVDVAKRQIAFERSD